NQIDKRTRRNTNALNDLITEQDLTDPTVQKEIDSLLEALEEDSGRIEKLNASADKILEDVDPEKLKYLRDLESARPDTWAIATWRDEKTRQQLDVKAQAEADAKAEACGAGSIKTGKNECTSCDALYSDYIAATVQGNKAGNSILERSGGCGWSAFAEESRDEKKALDNKDKSCDKDVAFSRAVPAGDGRYNCTCAEGTILASVSGSSACQSCDQVVGYINSALSNNNAKAASGLLAGAQGCGWYGEAVQVIANAERENEHRKRQAIDQLNRDLQKLNQQIQADWQRQQQETDRYNEWVRNKNRQPTPSASNPPKQKQASKPKTTSKKNKPSKTSSSKKKSSHKKSSSRKKNSQRKPASNKCGPGTIFDPESGTCGRYAEGEDTSGNGYISPY
ncbi:hypothetical protein DRQ25_15075, partial [Candidatus Fermentibacteria bacterium]